MDSYSPPVDGTWWMMPKKKRRGTRGKGRNTKREPTKDEMPSSQQRIYPPNTPLGPIPAPPADRLPPPTCSRAVPVVLPLFKTPAIEDVGEPPTKTRRKGADAKGVEEALTPPPPLDDPPLGAPVVEPSLVDGDGHPQPSPQQAKVQEGDIMRLAASGGDLCEVKIVRVSPDGQLCNVKYTQKTSRRQYWTSDNVPVRELQPRPLSPDGSSSSDLETFAKTSKAAKKTDESDESDEEYDPPPAAQKKKKSAAKKAAKETDESDESDEDYDPPPAAQQENKGAAKKATQEESDEDSEEDTPFAVLKLKIAAAKKVRAPREFQGAIRGDGMNTRLRDRAKDRLDEQDRLDAQSLPHEDENTTPGRQIENAATAARAPASQKSPTSQKVPGRRRRLKRSMDEELPNFAKEHNLAPDHVETCQAFIKHCAARLSIDALPAYFELSSKQAALATLEAEKQSAETIKNARLGSIAVCLARQIGQIGASENDTRIPTSQEWHDAAKTATSNLPGCKGSRNKLSKEEQEGWLKVIAERVLAVWQQTEGEAKSAQAAIVELRDMSKDPGYAEGRSVDEEPKGVFVKKKEGLPPGVVVGEYIGQTNIKNADYSEDDRKLHNENGYETRYDGQAWRLQHGSRNIDAGPSAAARCPGKDFLWMRYVNHSRKNPNMRPVSVNTGDTTQRVFFITVKNAPLGQELRFDYEWRVADQRGLSADSHGWMKDS